MRLKASIANVNDTEEMPAYTRGGWADFVQETDYYSKKWSPITCKNDAVEGGYSCTFENVMYPGNWDISKPENFQLNNIHDQVLIRFADVLLMQSELKEDVSGIFRMSAVGNLLVKVSVGTTSVVGTLQQQLWQNRKIKMYIIVELLGKTQLIMVAMQLAIMLQLVSRRCLKLRLLLVL